MKKSKQLSLWEKLEPFLLNDDHHEQNIIDILDILHGMKKYGEHQFFFMLNEPNFEGVNLFFQLLELNKPWALWLFSRYGLDINYVTPNNMTPLTSLDFSSTEYNQTISLLLNYGAFPTDSFLEILYSEFNDEDEQLYKDAIAKGALLGSKIQFKEEEQVFNFLSVIKKTEFPLLVGCCLNLGSFHNTYYKTPNFLKDVIVDLSTLKKIITELSVQNKPKAISVSIKTFYQLVGNIMMRHNLLKQKEVKEFCLPALDFLYDQFKAKLSLLSLKDLTLPIYWKEAIKQTPLKGLEKENNECRAWKAWANSTVHLNAWFERVNQASLLF